jgi:hypothetical protein
MVTCKGRKRLAVMAASRSAGGVQLANRPLDGSFPGDGDTDVNGVLAVANGLAGCF